MALTHTAPSAEDTLGSPVSESAANVQNAALDLVLPHLAGLDVNAQLVKRALIHCQTEPEPSVERLCHPPQLVVYANAGWKVATVSIGGRSGSYMVELARVGEHNQPLADRMRIVSGDEPENVALEISLHMGQPT
ncbi:hypothetical protein [Nonomuraea sp. NPDC052265]|uniref:hypothetical protein n=1 Tax=Nonomuraea sp. NPDC052265 TaxID=3364374 RepID=UPI0037C9BC56